MNNRILTSLLTISLAINHLAHAANKGPAWTDPDTAAKESPDFLLQGEYGENNGDSGTGIQVVALGNGQFQAAVYKGGLPGAGAKGIEFKLYKGQTLNNRTILKSPGGSVITLANGKATGEGFSYTKLTRKSPTLGQNPPKGSVVLFDGKKNGFNPGKTRGKYLTEGQISRDAFQDFHLHLEFRTPFKPKSKPGNQDRGNSGVYIFNNYETQILDSFGIKAEFNFCGALYRTKSPDVNMCLPPLSWQTYDIHFTAPRFKDAKKTSNARITTFHNGVRIHDDIELPKGTGAGGGRPEKPRSNIHLQGHGNPVSFKNIWLLPK